MAYRSGETAKRIAEDCGTSRDTIYRLLKAQSEPIRESGRTPKDIDADEVTRMYRDGWTVTELAHLFGCYRSTIDLRLFLTGAKPRPGQKPRAKAAAKPGRSTKRRT